jgi:steroid 5-alpha reductase family enzyme
MSLLLAVGLVWMAAAAVMALAWLRQRSTRNATLVDAVWAGALACAALFYGLVGTGSASARFGVAVLGALWGFRLCLHVLNRALNEDEDGRYAHLRRHWRDDQLKFFFFYQAQALLVVLFSLPFAAAAWNPALALLPWGLAAVAVWVLALAGETVADRQLAAWRAHPGNRGRACRAGLWRYSRHPNYFFEWLHWFAYVLLAVGSPLAWLAWLGPLLMFASLNWITGIPYTEAQALRSRGDDYRRYQAETSRFFPWPPRAQPNPTA